MTECEVRVKNPAGLHGRPTGMIVFTAKKFQSRITLSKDGSTADAKSIQGIMSLGVMEPCVVKLSAEGPDADDAVKSLKETIESIHLG